jgi:hypothetical protein
MARPSPIDSATLYPPGKKKKGCDGSLWMVRVTKTGVHRWVRCVAKGKDTAKDRRFIAFKAERKPLKISAFKNLIPGSSLKLCVFLFDSEKTEKFTFKFDAIEPVTGRLRNSCAFFVCGKSSYLKDLPLTVLNNGEIRIVISSDISPVYLNKQADL